MFELGLGLSAWKSAGPDRWALRNNPSSGNLHPTEGYLLLWRPAAPELPPGLYHYAPREHALEQRALLPAPVAQALAEAHPEGFGALGLSSIIWREEWKYGARAFRYCQHDVGHALAAVRFAAAVQGWRLCADPSAGDDAVAACLGLDRGEDFTDAEPEHPDLIALLGGPKLSEKAPDWSALAASLQQWQGKANRLSRERVRWPQIAQLLPAVHKGGGEVACASRPALPSMANDRPPLDACTLIRQRRSAQRMDGDSALGRADFELALLRTLPSGDSAPFDAFPYSTAVNLLLLVHAVDGLEPGLYALIRNAETFEDFRATCNNSTLEWEALNDTVLPLYRLLAPLDLRRVASQIGCFQGIAGQGAFAVAMLADLGGVLPREGAWAYRRLYWEAGLIGQVLYLEAEAAGLRGTGIGCFFDDEIHRLLGIGTGVAAWQALYQFTIGGPIIDGRLTTQSPYAHLVRQGQ
jgi:SagB-type dehydrogenase family enzyme